MKKLFVVVVSIVGIIILFKLLRFIFGHILPFAGGVLMILMIIGFFLSVAKILGKIVRSLDKETNNHQKEHDRER